MVPNLQASEILAWLTPTIVTDGDYRHIRLVENIEARGNAILRLRDIRKQVHEDAKHYLTQLTQDTLDPLGASPDTSVPDAYPGLLHINTKKGYFGEIMAGIVAETFLSSASLQWRVPVFLFRYHELAFDQLERWREVGTVPEQAFGQTGDDCLGFHVEAEGHVAATLVGEAKCTKDHDASMLGQAHVKVSSPVSRPLSLSRAIGILKEHDGDPETRKWLDTLQELYHRRDLRDHYKRVDFVNYTCGRRPKIQTDWAPVHAPHDSYKGGRELECVEVHLTNIDDLVETIYTD